MPRFDGWNRTSASLAKAVLGLIGEGVGYRAFVRDTLLPSLISGDLRVKDVEHIMERAA